MPTLILQYSFIYIRLCESPIVSIRLETQNYFLTFPSPLILPAFFLPLLSLSLLFVRFSLFLSYLLLFSIKEMSIAFNGGKDSVVLLHLIKLALDIKKHDTLFFSLIFS